MFAGAGIVLMSPAALVSAVGIPADPFVSGWYRGRIPLEIPPRLNPASRG
jgi:hypothetical protein